MLLISSHAPDSSGPTYRLRLTFSLSHSRLTSLRWSSRDSCANFLSLPSFLTWLKCGDYLKFGTCLPFFSQGLKTSFLLLLRITHIPGLPEIPCSLDVPSNKIFPNPQDKILLENYFLDNMWSPQSKSRVFGKIAEPYA